MGKCKDESLAVLWGKEAFGIGIGVFSYCPFYLRDWLDVTGMLEKYAIKTSGKQAGGASERQVRGSGVPVVLPMV